MEDVDRIEEKVCFYLFIDKDQLKDRQISILVWLDSNVNQQQIIPIKIEEQSYQVVQTSIYPDQFQTLNYQFTLENSNKSSKAFKIKSIDMIFVFELEFCNQNAIEKEIISYKSQSIKNMLTQQYFYGFKNIIDQYILSYNDINFAQDLDNEIQSLTEINQIPIKEILINAYSKISTESRLQWVLSVNKIANKHLNTEEISNKLLFPLFEDYKKLNYSQKQNNEIEIIQNLAELIYAYNNKISDQWIINQISQLNIAFNNYLSKDFLVKISYRVEELYKLYSSLIILNPQSNLINLLLAAFKEFLSQQQMDELLIFQILKVYSSLVVFQAEKQSKLQLAQQINIVDAKEFSNQLTQLIIQFLGQNFNKQLQLMLKLQEDNFILIIQQEIIASIEKKDVKLLDKELEALIQSLKQDLNQQLKNRIEEIIKIYKQKFQDEFQEIKAKNQHLFSDQTLILISSDDQNQQDVFLEILQIINEETSQVKVEQMQQYLNNKCFTSIFDYFQNDIGITFQQFKENLEQKIAEINNLQVFAKNIDQYLFKDHLDQNVLYALMGDTMKLEFRQLVLILKELKNYIKISNFYSFMLRSKSKSEQSIFEQILNSIKVYHQHNYNQQSNNIQNIFSQLRKEINLFVKFLLQEPNLIIPILENESINFSNEQSNSSSQIMQDNYFEIIDEDNNNQMNLEYTFKSIVFPDNIITFQKLCTIAGLNFEEAYSKINRLLSIIKLDNPIKQTLQSIYHVNFLINNGESLINILEKISKIQEIKLSKNIQKEIASKEFNEFKKSIRKLSDCAYNSIHSIIESKNTELNIVLKCLGKSYLGQTKSDADLKQLDNEDLLRDINSIQNMEFNNIADDDTDNINALVILTDIKKLFDYYLVINKSFEQGQSISQLVSDLVEFVRDLSSKDLYLTFIDCTKNFYQLESISFIQKTKNIFQIVREFVFQGKFVFSLNQTNKNVDVSLIGDKCYSMKEVKQIHSKITIELNMKVKSLIMLRHLQQLNQNRIPKQMYQQNMDNHQPFNEEEEEDKIREEMNVFKEQWLIAEQIQEVLEFLIQHGNYTVLSHEIKFSNGDNPHQNIKNLQQLLIKLSLIKDQWINELNKMIKIYPYLSMIGFEHYQEFYQLINQQKNIEQCDPNFQQLIRLFSNKIERDPLNYFKNHIDTFKQLIQQNLNSDQAQVKEEHLEYSLMDIEDNYYEGAKRISRIAHKDSAKLIELLINENNIKYYRIFQYSEDSTLADLLLFSLRYEYLWENQESTYYFIINQKPEPKFLDKASQILKELTQRKQQNNMILFITPEVELFQFIPLNNQQIIKKSSTYENAQFYHSDTPGSGKTFVIQKQLKNIDQQFRISIYRSTNKKELIQQFRDLSSVMSKEQQIYIHLDLFEMLNYDLTMFLYELIYLKTISIHSNQIVYLGEKVFFFIEIANTLDEELFKSVSVKQHCRVFKIDFSIEKYETSCLKGEQEENYLMCQAVLESFSSDDYSNLIQQFSNEDQAQFKQFLKNHKLDNFLKNLQKVIDILNREINQSQQNNGQFSMNQNQNQGIYFNQFQSFHQLISFINLFGCEMRKFYKCPYLSEKLEDQQIISAIQNNETYSQQDKEWLINYQRNNISQDSIQVFKTIIGMSLKISLLASLPFKENLNDQIQANQSKEMKLQSKSSSFKDFNLLLMDFLTFQEQEHPCVTSFFLKEIPISLRQLFGNEYQNTLLLDVNDNSKDLLRWLVRLMHKNEAQVYMNCEGRGVNNLENIRPQYEKLKQLAQKIIISKDNFFKIAMLFMRIRSNSPIVIMGQAGIGKTKQIQLMAQIMEADFKTKTIHAGVTQDEITKFIQSAYHIQGRVILFFDEVNTSKLVGGIFKDIMIDRRLNNQPIPDNIIPIAAINPYQLKSQRQKEIMSIQIHGGIKKDKMLKSKSSDLEYMVEVLPESMYSFIWNFNKLNEKDEQNYIDQIIKNNREYRILPDQDIKLLNDCIYYSQSYIRNQMGFQSAASLRDVARFIKLFFWFNNFLRECQLQDIQINFNMRICIFFSFQINYCIRLPLYQQRKVFKTEISLRIGINIEDKRRIKYIKNYFIQQLDIPQGIIKNKALKDNTFALFVSLMNKIPVVLIGPPGSSKTLSLNILINSMKGDLSKNSFLKRYPKLISRFYQGHVQSTSERILEIFNQAKENQEKYDQQNQPNQPKLLSLLYIDELGLAEISPHNPLKVLHQTLEDPQFAIACLSNWPLDSSKMNRMLQIYRMDVDKKELRDIFNYLLEDILRDKLSVKNSLLQLDKDIPSKMAQFYSNYMQLVKSEQPEYQLFHGLRDYYSVTKLIITKIKDQENQINLLSLNKIIINSIFRHFSGYCSKQLVQALKNSFGDMMIAQEDYIQVDLIRQNIHERSDDFLSRHLMIISKFPQKAISMWQGELIRMQREHHTIIGSDFPKDQQQDNSFKAIWEIINYAANGKVVIIQNLDEVYQCLYELLNQNYTTINKKHTCKISFGATSSNIEVHQNFKLILVVDDAQVQKMDGPLLNRFEKHFYDESMEYSQELKQFIDRIFIDQREMLPFINLKNVIENIVNSQHNINDFNEEKIKQQIYDLTTLRHIISSQSNGYDSNYITSGYHFSLKSFIRNRIIQQKPEDQGRLYCIYSPTSLTYFIHGIEHFELSQIDSSKVFISKIQNFIRRQEQLYQQQRGSEKYQYENILQIICDCEQDSYERLNYIKQLAIEELFSIKDKKVKACIIITMKIKNNFQVLPFYSGCEQYYIEELQQQYNESINGQMITFDLKDLLLNSQQNILYHIKINIQNILQNQDWLFNCYYRITFNNIQNTNYTSQRLQQLLTIFNPSFYQLKPFVEESIHLINQRIIYQLQFNQQQQINSFIHQILVDNNNSQTDLLSDLIKKKIERIVEDGIAWFLSKLEKEQMIYSIFSGKENKDLIELIIKEMKGFDVSEVILEVDISQDYLLSQSKFIIQDINKTIQELRKEQQLKSLISNDDTKSQKVTISEVNLYEMYHNNNKEIAQLLCGEYYHLRYLIFDDNCNFNPFSKLSKFSKLYIKIVQLILNMINLQQIQNQIENQYMNQDYDHQLSHQITLLLFHREEIQLIEDFINKFSHFNIQSLEVIWDQQLIQKSSLTYNKGSELYPYLKVFCFILLNQTCKLITQQENLQTLIDSNIYDQIINPIEILARQFKFNKNESFLLNKQNLKIINLLKTQILNKYKLSLDFNLLQTYITKNQWDFQEIYNQLNQQLSQNSSNSFQNYSEMNIFNFKLDWSLALLNSMIILMKTNQELVTLNQYLEQILSIDVTKFNNQSEVFTESIKAKFQKIFQQISFMVLQKLNSQPGKEVKVEVKVESGMEIEDISQFDNFIFRRNVKVRDLESQIFFINLFSNCMSKQQYVDLLYQDQNDKANNIFLQQEQYLFSNSFQDLNNLERLFYVSILKYSIDYITNQQNQNRQIYRNQLKIFYEQLKHKGLQEIIIIQLYKNNNQSIDDMKETVKNNFHLQECKWIYKLIFEDKRLSYSDYLNEEQMDYYNKYFSNKHDLKLSIKNLLIREQSCIKNVLKNMQEGKLLCDQFYPLMRIRNNENSNEDSSNILNGFQFDFDQKMQVEDIPTLSQYIFYLLYCLSIDQYRIKFEQDNNTIFQKFKNVFFSNKNQFLINKFLRLRNEENVEDFLIQQINLAFDKIMTFLSNKFKLLEEQRIVLFQILSSIIRDQTLESKQNLQDIDNLNQKIIQNITAQVQQAQHIIQDQTQSQNNNNFSIYQQIKCQNWINRFSSSIYLIGGDAAADLNNYKIILNKLNAENHDKTKGLLQILQNQETDLLKILIQFSELVIKYLNNKVDKQEAQSNSLLKLLDNNANHPLFLFYTQKVVSKWNEVVDKQDSFLNKQNIQYLDTNTPLNYLLLCKEEDQDMHFELFNKILRYFSQNYNSLNQYLIENYFKDEKIQVHNNIFFLNNKAIEKQLFFKYILKSHNQNDYSYIFDEQSFYQDIVPKIKSRLAIINLDHISKYQFKSNQDQFLQFFKQQSQIHLMEQTLIDKQNKSNIQTFIDFDN